MPPQRICLKYEPKPIRFTHQNDEIHHEAKTENSALTLVFNLNITKLYFCLQFAVNPVYIFSRFFLISPLYIIRLHCRNHREIEFSFNSLPFK